MRSYIPLLILSIFPFILLSQKDTLTLKNKDIIAGEIKSFNNGVLVIETDYSDSDFKIEWSGVQRIATSRSFLITLNDGTRLTGTLKSISDDEVSIWDIDIGIVHIGKDHVVFLKHIDQGFWSNFSASLDVGFSLTKANNLSQFSLRSKLGYLTRRWQTNADFSLVRSTQDNVADIDRYEANFGGRYFLPDDWLVLSNLSFLSNTEQALDLRSNLQLGPGKFIIHTNSIYWVAVVGVAYSNEQFFNDTPSRNSLEGYMAMDFNMFDTGDFQLKTLINAYPSITESGRFRLDYQLDTKYDLPLDFYISLGLTLNYDNQPAEAGRETDYVVQTGVGWEF